MRTGKKISTTKINLPLDIKRACCTLGFLGSLTGPMLHAANPIERSSTQAFSIPNTVVGRIKVGPVLTTINGEDYLQFITSTQYEDTYLNTIAGPIDKLLDRTIPWEEVIYSNYSFVLESLSFPGGTLVDLNNDGVNSLISDGSKYDVTNSLTLVTDDPFSGAVSPVGLESPPVFIDMDQDNDLDMFISNWKYSYTNIYENVGSPEVPVFILLEEYYRDDLAQFISSYLLSLPRGFLNYFDALFESSFPAIYGYPLIKDFDNDGDQDLLMRNQSYKLLTYYEQSEKNGISLYSEPFGMLPDRDHRATWVTDYDTDGDLDLLVKTINGELKFYERTNIKPNQYARPVRLTNFPQWSIYYYGSPGVNSISRSEVIFEDIDNDGYQEMLLIKSTPSREYQVILLRKTEDNSFDQQLIYQMEEIENDASYSLQFIDGNRDGRVDIALQFYQYFEETTSQPILLFEQDDSLTFTGPTILASDALNLIRSWNEYLETDFDQDGDIDKVYNHSVTWNLESNPGSIVNFSTRSFVGDGPNILIGGFIIEGESPQTVILRGIGPSLSEKGVKTPLLDPDLYLFSGDRLIAHNDDWQSTEGADKIESAGIALEHPNESALRIRLNPGTYTVHLKGKSGDTGVGIFGIDTDNQMPTNALQINISGRALVGEGEDLTIGGFIVEGDSPVKVLIRGLGPQLEERGVEGVLSDPTLTLFLDNSIIASNNDWKSDANASEIAELVNAPTYDSEAAILTDLAPGSYTVHLRGRVGGSGVGIIAVDQL
ncbi:MAG: VCBS repeat-containing protein [Candidatus Thiodiazotropha sp. (ex Lucinoma borealis)]|nr:VCBS repeat-containing protein [Candidatus Thiodiazotropha sp. (ex Lucinoma borealis)]MCU7868171.1 VCBS repeat-containing protein [Candidatus Thiodiazotropha sp. (ex Lucinoma borealis)]